MGKSTLAVNLAVAAVQSRKRVLIIDLDFQGSSSMWWETRIRDRSDGDRGRLSAAQITHRDLEAALTKAQDQGVDWVIIDTPGRSSVDVNAAIERSDLALIPSRPSKIDLQPAGETVQACSALGKTFAYLFNLVRSRQETRDVTETLEMAGLPVCPVTVSERSDIEKAFGKGQGVIEGRKSASADEIKALFQWLKKTV